MSLLSPPAGFPAHLVCFWPLIWVQILMLRAAIRAAYGKGVKYHWSVSPNGRVFLASIDWIPGQKKRRVHLQPAAYSNARLADACNGKAYAPTHITTLSISAHPGAGRDPESLRVMLAALNPGLRPAEGGLGTLPLPET